MLRAIAILANVCWLLFFAYLLVDKGKPYGRELDILVAATITIIVNVAALWAIGAVKPPRSLIGLYMERLRMEQQQRIDQLRDRSSH
jgi:hypothetical protein